MLHWCVDGSSSSLVVTDLNLKLTLAIDLQKDSRIACRPNWHRRVDIIFNAALMNHYSAHQAARSVLCASVRYQYSPLIDSRFEREPDWMRFHAGTLHDEVHNVCRVAVRLRRLAPCVHLKQRFLSMDMQKLPHQIQE
jgi:hypothetical protein